MTTTEHSPCAPRRIPLALQFLLGAFVACAVWTVGSVVGASGAGAAITGVDVASYQHPGGAAIDWNRVAAAGHRFAYVKATEATSYTNPYFANDWNGIGAAGMYRGAYHYAKPQLPLTSAEAQAQYFVSRVGSSTGPADLPLELDLEETGGLGQSDLASWTRRFLAEVTRLTGKRPLVYTGRWFWAGNIGAYGNDIGQTYVLWTADYHCQRSDGSLLCDPNTDTYNPPVYGGWQQWTFWQNYSVGAVPGIIGDVDMNRFCCDAATLASLAGAAVGAGSPFGSADSITPVDATHATIGGWVIDPDTRGPTQVHVYPNGAGTGSTAVVGNANLTRDDVGAAYPGYGSDHGFSITVPIGPGVTQLCAYGINVAGGANVLLGCLAVGTPFGYADVISSPAPGKARVAGWLRDPDGDQSVTYTVSAGAVRRDFTANTYRSDVGNHAYDVTIDVPGGRQTVCVTAHNAAGAGGDATIDCATLDLPTGSPQGSVDVVLGGVGRILVGGWAIDPDTTASIQVHVYVDGVGTALAANGDRSDLLSIPAYSPYGAAHGYAAWVNAGPGSHRVCLYGIETAGSGANVELGCRTTTVFGPDPFGSFDLARGVTRGVSVAGWAIDPDTVQPTQVHVYVDNVGTPLVANSSRPDLAVANPAWSLFGPSHGFAATVPADPGLHTVCAYAINTTGGGQNVSLGCRLVFVNSGIPFGTMENVLRISGYGVVYSAGWVIDPKVTTPTTVHFYVNGQWAGSTVANGSRPDIDGVFGYGATHGFSWVGRMVGSGPQTVCAYAIDSATVGGTNTLLGCRTV